MFKVLDYKDIDGSYILIDVRSPMEFKEATIPNSINIPLFNDEERKEIGTIYVNESVEKAKKLGIEVVSKRLPEIYNKLSALDKEYDKLIFFCARGGMRSSSISSLAISLGMNAYRLRGGYKGYREFINENLPKVNEKVKYIVLHGKTGVGKTKILHNLRRDGYDVLDLEGAANHRGSLLGGVGLGSMRSQKQFESIVYETLKNRKTNYVIVEGESKRIGNIIIPEYIFTSMEQGVNVLLEADIDLRADILMEDYASKSENKNEIIEALNKMSKYISENNISRYKELIVEEEFKQVAEELMIKYYDPMYSHDINKYEYDLKLKVENIDDATCIIEDFMKNYSEN